MGSTEMVEVVIDSIRVSLMSQQRIVILKEKDAERYLTIWIGVYEAEAITIALQGVEVARPLTHDLLKNVFNQLGARLLRAEVVALRDDTYYGSLVVEFNGQQIEIDARPSDALAIAVRANIPILVARSVMEAAGIVPEEDLQEPSAPATPAEPTESAPVESDERLSVFSDFLSNLDLSSLEDDEGSEGSEPDKEP